MLAGPIRLPVLIQPPDDPTRTIVHPSDLAYLDTDDLGLRSDPNGVATTNSNAKAGEEMSLAEIGKRRHAAWLASRAGT